MSSKSSNPSKSAARAAKTAELRAQQERAERRRRMLMIGGVAGVLIVVLGGIIGFSIWQQSEDDERLAAAASKNSDYGITIGPDDADHQVVVYEDFICSHCGDFEAATHEELEDLAEEGTVQVEYRPFNLLGNVSIPNAFAVVLEESGPTVAKAYHDLLFEAQGEFFESEPDSDRLVELAVEAGGEESAVRPGIEDGAQQSWVEGATEEAADAGVSSTPTVLLDGERFEGGPQDLLDAVG